MLLTLVSGSSSSNSRASRGGSSSNSARSSPPPTPPPPLPPPPTVPVVPAMVPPPPTAFVIEPNQALVTNLLALVSSRMGRALDPPEAAELTEALRSALAVLQAGDPTIRERLLSSRVLEALSHSSGAWLWAATVEALEVRQESVASLAVAITDGCAAIAGALFTSVSAVLF